MKTSPLKWILGNDTGVSSKTIWAVMMGETDADMPFGYDVPCDPDDFGRCYRLLKLFPEWKNKLYMVAEKFPKWGPLVSRWDTLEELYEQESPSGRCPKLYELMQELVSEGRRADGWVEVGPGSWIKKQA